MKKSMSLLAGVLAAAMVATVPAAGQEADPDSLDVVPLRPVLVNVLRTPFSVTSAPFAVAANGEAEVQRARPGLGLDEALGGIPGVQIDDRYNYALGDRISIRGFGARTQFGVRGVKVLVDGIPATLPDGQTNLNHVDLSFLRRVEVIRGPASALYGNAAGGVIHFQTELPPAVPVSQEVGVVAGSDGLLRFHSTTGGRSGGANYMLNVARLTYDGFREFQDADNVQVNASVGSALAGGDLRITGSFVDYDANNPGSLDAPRLDADRTQACCRTATGDIRNNLQFQTGEEGRQSQLGAFWSRPAGSGQIEVSTYGITREISNPIPFVIIDIERRAGGFSALYRSSSVATREGLSWAAGFEGDLQDDVRKNFANENGATGDLEVDQDEQVLGGAAFAQLTAVPTAGLTAVAGLRYDATRFEVDDNFTAAGDPDDSGSRTMSAFSPSIGLSYEVAPALSLYGNVATSFETPTTTELANQETQSGGFNPDLEPQRAVSFEAGAKGLVNDVLSYQVSAYRTNIEDVLIQFTRPDDRSYFLNTGSAVHQGVEIGATVAPIRQVRANVAYTYIDARFDDFTQSGTSFADNRIPGVTPHRVDASVTYTAPFGWYSTLEGRYADEMPVNNANTFSSPAYTVVDFRTGLEAIDVGGLAIEPFVGVTNLLDEEYNTSVTVNAFGSRFFEPGPGRSFYAGGQIRVNVD